MRAAIGVITQRLKGAARLLIRDAGGIEAAAEISGLTKSTLARYQDLGAPEFMPVHVAALLEAQDGVRPHVTQAMAALGGHVLLPRLAIDGDAAGFKRVADLVKEAGDVISGLGEALQDGRISAEEVGKLGLRTEVAQLASLVAGIDAWLEGIEKGGTP